MKKYVISLTIVLLCVVMIVLFSLPDRVQFAFNGMASYDTDDYNVINTNLPKCELNIDFSTYNNQDIMVYEYDNNIKLSLDSIQYRGDSYRFCFISKGYGKFTGGSIINFAESNEDNYIKNSYGDFVFQYSGNSSLVDDCIEYYFDLYPKDENFDVDRFSTMNITLPINKLMLTIYERI